MYSLETSLFALFLFAGSVLLVRWHWVAWQSAAREDLDEAHRNFLYGQCRRRVQASGMIGWIGIAMFLGQFLDRWPLVKVFHWSGILVLVAWVMLLALADLFVTRHHYGRLRRDHLLAEMRYHAELRHRARDDNAPDEERSGS